MDQLLRRMWQEDDAQDIIEYVLLLMFISIAFVAMSGSFSGPVSAVFSEGVSAMGCGMTGVCAI